MKPRCSFLAAKGFESGRKWRQGKKARVPVLGASSGLEASSRGFRWGPRGKRRSSRAEALAPHAAASKGSSARPSVSAPPLFPRTIYIMYDHDVTTRTPGPDPTSRQDTSRITIVYCHLDSRQGAPKGAPKGAPMGALLIQRHN